MNSSSSSKSSWYKIPGSARIWMNSVPQTAATTFAFASVFILLLRLCPHLNMWETSGLYGLTFMKSWDYSIPEAASWTKIKATSQLTSNMIISMFNKLSCSWQNNYLYFYRENFSHFTSKGFLFHLRKKNCSVLARKFKQKLQISFFWWRRQKGKNYFIKNKLLIESYS